MPLIDDIRGAFKALKPVNGILDKHALISWLIDRREEKLGRALTTPQTAAAYSSLITKLAWKKAGIMQRGERYSVVIYLTGTADA